MKNICTAFHYALNNRKFTKFFEEQGFEYKNDHENSFGLKKIYNDQIFDDYPHLNSYNYELVYDKLPDWITCNYYFHEDFIKNNIVNIYIFNIGMVLDINKSYGQNIISEFIPYENSSSEENYQKIIDKISNI